MIDFLDTTWWGPLAALLVLSALAMIPIVIVYVLVRIALDLIMGGREEKTPEWLPTRHHYPRGERPEWHPVETEEH